MSRYDRMATIPRHVEREVSGLFDARRNFARNRNKAYCPACDQVFCNPEALSQHNRDAHNGPAVQRKVSS